MVNPLVLACKFAQVYESLTRRPSPPVYVEYYHYRGLTNTVRVRDGEIRIRISDILRDEAEPVLTATVTILAHKLLRKAVPVEARQTYRKRINSPALIEKTRTVRRLRGRKRKGRTQGKVFNLEHLFSTLNAEYFGNQLQVDHLAWSKRPSRRTLGHWDDAHRAIVLSSRLDNPLVPDFVISFVLYHEMLHAALGEVVSNGRRQIHHAEFRKAERRFREFREAKNFIRRFLRTRQ